MEQVMQGVPDNGWLEIVGSEYEASYLDSPVLRQRSAALPSTDQRPAVRKLTTPDGRHYKLLYVPRGNPKVREIYQLIQTIRGEAFMPQLLWSDKHSLLFEFIEGEFPKLVSRQFSIDLAKALARLHDYRYANISTLRYRLEFLHNLNSLRRHDLINEKYTRQARALYKQTRPAYIRRSLDYFDINRNNFIYDKDGKLWLIDAGAFRNNRPTGQFFLGSTHFQKLNEDVFWQTYAEAGGDRFLYDNRTYLRLFHYVMKAGQKSRVFARKEDKSSREASRYWQRCVNLRDRLIELLDSE